MRLDGGGGRWLALVALLAALAAADKRAEMAPQPFVLGSRYGRAPERAIAPRNDKFFMGPRYGKRSELPDTPLGAPRVRGASVGDERALSCQYSGVGALYHCRPDPPPRRRLHFRGDPEEPSIFSEN